MMMLNPQISPNEDITRYLFSGHVNASGKIRYNAFMPSKKTHDVSVYRIINLDDVEIVSIGREFVEAKRGDGKKIVARADFKADEVLRQNLSIVPDPNPHPRHTNITGWPSYPEEQKEKALALAMSARLKRPID